MRALCAQSGRRCLRESLIFGILVVAILLFSIPGGSEAQDTGTNRGRSIPADPVSRDELAEALTSLPALVSIPKERWEATHEDLATDVVRAWKVAKQANIEFMQIGAVDAAVNAAVAPQLDDATVAERQKRQVLVFLIATEERQAKIVRNQSDWVAKLDEVVHRLGPAAAVPLLAAGEEDRVRKLGPNAIAVLEAAAAAADHPQRERCAAFLGKAYPLAEFPPPALGYLLTTALTETRSQPDRAEAVRQLCLHPGKVSDFAPKLLEIRSAPIVEAEVSRTLANLGYLDSLTIRRLQTLYRQTAVTTEANQGREHLLALEAYALTRPNAVAALEELFVLEGNRYFVPAGATSHLVTRRFIGIRGEIAESLGGVGSAAKSAIPELAKAMRDASSRDPEAQSRMRIRIAAAMRAIGSDGVLELRQLWEQGIEEAAFGLTAREIPVSDLLKKLTSTSRQRSVIQDDLELRWLELLGDHGPDARSAAPILLQRLRVARLSHSAPIPYCQALSQMGPEIREAATAVILERMSEQQDIHGCLPKCLALFPELNEAARGELVRLARGSPANEMSEAIRALGICVQREPKLAAEYVPIIAAGAEYLTTYAASCEALAGIGPIAASEADRLLKLLADSDFELQRGALVKALTAMGAEDRAGSALRDRNADTRSHNRQSELVTEALSGKLKSFDALESWLHSAEGLPLLKQQFHDLPKAEQAKYLPILRRLVVNRGEPFLAADAAELLWINDPRAPGLMESIAALKLCTERAVRIRMASLTESH